MGPIINQCEASWFKGKVKPRTSHIRFCRVGDKDWSLIIKVKNKNSKQLEDAFGICILKLKIVI